MPASDAASIRTPSVGESCLISDATLHVIEDESNEARSMELCPGEHLSARVDRIESDFVILDRTKTGIVWGVKRADWKREWEFSYAFSK